MLQGLLIAASLALPLTAAAPAQDDAPAKPKKPTEAERIDQYLRHARTGSARIRPQAAQRLLRIGAPAAERLLEVSGTKPAELAVLGTALIEIMGRFDNPELRGRLWPAIDDSDFPWRPAAARSVASSPLPAERARFIELLDDPIAPVRLAALDALFRMTVAPDPAKPRDENKIAEDEAHRRAFLGFAAKQLRDENDVVRRNAAVLLDARGHGRALLWLVEDLARTDMFFDKPTGLMARYESSRMLRERGIDLGDYVTELPPAQVAGGPKENNAAALAALRKQIEKRAAAMLNKVAEADRGIVPSTIPEVARAVPAVEGAVLGLELKSCRRGDFFLRWTEDDVLLVGDGNPTRIQLPKGTTAGIVKVSLDAQLETEGNVFWGQPGCDVESYRMPRASGPADVPQQLIVSKGEERVVDLRPGALRRLGEAMAASVPAGDSLEGDDPRTRDLAARVHAAFASIGGPVADEEESADKETGNVPKK